MKFVKVNDETTRLMRENNEKLKEVIKTAETTLKIIRKNNENKVNKVR